MESYYKFIASYFGIIVFFLAVFIYLLEAKYKKYHKFIQYTYIFLLVLFIFYLFGNNLFAQWWLIDDHDIFAFIGNYETKVGFSDYWNIILNKTEVGAFGNFPRYRPSYYMLRTLELIIWQDNPFLWYAFRILILLLFVIAIYNFLAKYLSYITSFLFVLWVFSYNYWSDIFSRMGPAEIYGTLGFSLVLLGAKSKIEDRIKNKWVSLFFYLGIIIMIGAKENFLYFFLIPFFYIIFLIKKNRHRGEIIGFLISGGYFTLIVLSLFLYFANSKQDVYGNSTSIGSRLKIFVNILSFTETKMIFLMLISTSILVAANHLKNKLKINYKMPAIYIIFFLGYYLLNYLFYNGNWPTSMRYDFPGILAYQFIIFFLMVTLHSIFLKRIGFIYINIALILFLSFNVNTKAMGEIRISSLENIRRTTEFTEFLNTQKEILKADKSKKIFLLMNDPFDFEPILSFERFLNYYKVPNKKYVVINSFNKYNGLAESLFISLSNLSLKGNNSILPFQEKEYENSDCVFYMFRDISIKDFGADCKRKEFLRVPW